MSQKVFFKREIKLLQHIIKTEARSKSYFIEEKNSERREGL